MSCLRTLHKRRAVVVGLAAAMLVACGHEPVRRVPIDKNTRSKPVAVTPVRQSAGQRAATVALRQVGVPYVYGGSTVRGFDCSGLVQYAYRNAGKKVPRTTGEQWRQMSPVNGESLRVGDVLFFRIEGKVAHVGLYIGGNRFVHAPSSGRQVSVESLESGFYRQAFVRAARPF